MPYTKVVLPTPSSNPTPIYIGGKSYNPQDDRRFYGDIFSPGVVGAGDFLVTFSATLTVSVAAGVAYIRGGNTSDQGIYRVRTTSANTIAVGAGAANPRLDQIILRVLDADHDASGVREARIEVVPGTATAGATLDNRTGATSLTGLDEGSSSVLLIADVLVPASAGSINSSNIRDKRVWAWIGGDTLQPYAVVSTHSANQATVNNTLLVLAFNTDEYDPRGLHDVSAPNNTKFTAIKAGFYSVGATVQWEGNATGARDTRLRKNGTTDIEKARGISGDALSFSQSMQTGIFLNVGDYLEVTAQQNSGGALNILASASYSPRFRMWMV